MIVLLTQKKIGDELWLSGNKGIEQVFPDVGTLVSNLLPNLYLVAGLLLLALLIFGGLGVIMGAGEDDPKKVDQGKRAVTYALVGFLIVFTSYWIIQIIETVTGVEIFNSGL